MAQRIFKIQHQTTCVVHHERNERQMVAEQNTRWAEHSQQLLNRQSLISEEALMEIPQNPVIETLNSAPTIAETAKAISQMASGKASVADGIPTELYKHGGSLNSLTSHLEKIWDTEIVPQDFKDGLIIHLSIYKPKGDKGLCDNHHGIQLLCFAGKS